MNYQASLYAILLLGLCITPLGSQSVCNYSIDCPDTPADPDCECFDQPMGYIVALEDGDLEITVNMQPEPYSCCGETFGGSVFFSARLTNGIEVASGAGTHLLPCIAKGDTVLTQFSGTSGSHTISSAVINLPTFGEDEEPNNAIPEATYIAEGQPMEGHVGYGFYNKDQGDYYRIEIPEDGDLHIEAAIDRKGALALFSPAGGFSITDQVTAEPDTLTIDIPCVAEGDVFYLLVWTQNVGCTGYRVQYQVTPPFAENDTEPNETWAEAIDLPFDGAAQGHLRYGFYGADVYDNYWITSPEEGELRIGAVFEKGGRLALFDLGGVWSIGDAETFAGGDTIYLTVPCVAAGDEFRLSVRGHAGLCTGYRVFGKVAPPSYPEDADTDEGIPGALPLPAGATLSGRIGYGYYTNDLSDTYEITTVDTGTLVIEARFEAGGRINLRAADGAFLESRHTNQPGILTIDYGCVPAGSTYYVEVVEYQSICSGYELSYQVGPTGISADAEVTHVTGEDNGAVDLSVFGGTEPYTFLWNNGAQTEDLSGVGVGTYSVTITDGRGCVSVLNNIVVQLATDTEDLAAVSGLTLYPNPNNGQFYLSLSASFPRPEDLRVFDPTGRVVFRQNGRLPSEDLIPVSLGEAPAGLYYVQLVTGERTISCKVVVR